MFQKGVYNQIATYWGNPTDNGVGGKTFGTPILISIRWEDNTNLQIPVDGEIVVSRAVVYTDYNLKVGGWIALGDLSSNVTPQGIDGAYPIRTVGFSTSVLGEQSLSKAVLTS